MWLIRCQQERTNTGLIRDAKGKEKRALIELSRFLLNRKTENIRGELYEYLILCALSRYPNKKMGRPDIESQIMSDFNLHDLPSLHMDAALERLGARQQIVDQIAPDGTRKYLLSKASEEGIGRMERRYDELSAKAKAELVTFVGEEYQGSFNPDLPFGIMVAVLGSVFAEYGILCAEFIAGIKGEAADLVSLPDFATTLNSELEAVKEGRLRAAIADALYSFFSKASRESFLFLYVTAQSYILTKILNIDPDMKKLEQKALGNKILFLDTNIVLSLMCVAQLHEPIVNLVRLTRNLGVQMVFTGRTKTEFLEQLAAAKERYSQLGPVSQRLVSSAEQLMEDPFISSFWRAHRDTPGMTWDGFCFTMESFPAYLKQEFDIRPYETEHREILEQNEFRGLISALSLASEQKTEEAVEHDAYHIMLVQTLREDEPPSELGPSTWFLTRDLSLGKAQIERYGRHHIPSSMGADIWLSMIGPLISPTVMAKEGADSFGRIMTSRFPVLTQSVRPSDLIDFMSLGIPEDFLDTESLKKAIGDKFVRQYLTQNREARARGETPPDSSRLLESLLKIKTEETERKYESRVKELERLLEQSRPARVTPKQLLLAGLLCFLLIAITGAISTGLGLDVPSYVYLVMGLISLGLMISSCFGPSGARELVEEGKSLAGRKQ
jgi:hypothetical protein